MLSGYWLLSDLDGTLISTPHKAHGLYLPLNKSPCFHTIQRWMLHGGNVCIVTTADSRVFSQVYLPLRECLRSSEEHAKAYWAEYDKNTGDRSGREKAVVTTMNNALGAEQVYGRQYQFEPVTRNRLRVGGSLLLSLYTGAVIYHCTYDSVVLLPGYATAVHCATKESVWLTRSLSIEMPKTTVYVDSPSPSPSSPSSSPAPASAHEEQMQYCVKGTCISRSVAHKLQLVVKKIYLRYLSDILRGTPKTLEAIKCLSRRYKRMWRGLLVFLDLLYVTHVAAAGGGSEARKAYVERLRRERLATRDFTLHSRLNSIAEADSTEDFSILASGAAKPLDAQDAQMREEAIQWKLAYFDGRDDFLAAVGALRVEYVDFEVSFEELFPHVHSVELSSSAAAATSERNVVEHLRQVLSRGLSKEKLSENAVSVIVNFSNFIVSLLGPDQKDLQKRIAGSGDGKGSVEDVAQVIVLGIPITLFSTYFKSYMTEFVTAGVHALPQPNSVVFSKMGVSKSTALRYLLGKNRVVEEGNSVGGGGARQKPKNFGHVVHCERSIALGDNPQSTDYELTVFPDVPFVSVEKTSQREARHHRIARAHQKAQLPPERARLQEALRRSGTLMDDRLVANLQHVGGEEEGTHEALSTLMDVLLVPQITPGVVPRSLEATEHMPLPIEPEEFRDALVLALKYARANVRHKAKLARAEAKL